MPTSSRIALALCAVAPTLHAQAVRVRAVEEGSARPLAGAIADVLDDQGRTVAQRLLGDDGRRLIGVGAGGSYRVRVRRIGFEPFVSPTIAVGATDTVDVALRVPARRVMLSAMQITGSRRCAREANAGGAVATLLEEARKALTSTTLARTDGSLTLVGRTFDRRLREDGKELELRVGLPRRTASTRPFVAAPASYLSTSGYVLQAADGVTFFGPDEEVLLSDEFLRDHCFEAIEGTRETRGLFGVHFTPAPNRRVADIVGTLWVDSATAELRFLDFWYADGRLPDPVLGEGKSGGRVVFEALPNGRWIVSAWHLRMPRFESRRIYRYTRPDGYYETGGVVTGIARSPDGPPPALASALAPYEKLAEPARVTGSVYDSVTMRPIANARVWLVPVSVRADDLPVGDARLAIGDLSARTDSTGQYVIDSIPAGTFHLTVEAPTHDSAGIRLPEYDVRLAPAMRVAADFTTPSLATLSRGCVKPSPSVPAPGVLFGTVRAAESGRPVQNAMVRVSWRDLARVSRTSLVAPNVQVIATTGKDGTWRVCDVPRHAVALVQAFAKDVATAAVDTPLEPLGVRRRDLTLAVNVDGGPTQPTAMLRGMVRARDGTPIPGVTIALDDDGRAPEAGAAEPRTTTTDRNGRYTLRGLPLGTQVFTTSMIGYVPATFAAEMRSRDSTFVDVTLDVVQTLAALMVTDSTIGLGAGVRDAIERHRMGLGQLILGAELERAPQVRSLFAGRIPGVQVYQYPPPPFAPGSKAGTWTLMMAKGPINCEMRVFIDERETDAEEMLSLNPTMLRAVEVFTRASEAPRFAWQLSSKGDANCGVVIFWTVSAR